MLGSMLDNIVWCQKEEDILPPEMIVQSIPGLVEKFSKIFKMHAS